MTTPAWLNREALAPFWADGHGVSELFVVRRDSFPALMLEAVVPGSLARMLVTVINDWLRQTCAAAPSSGPLCVSCDHEFGTHSLPAACLLFVPFACTHGT